jgi:hypothetical protein
VNPLKPARIRYADRARERDGGNARPSWTAIAEVYPSNAVDLPADVLGLEAEIDRLLDREQRDAWLWRVGPGNDTYPWCGNPMGRNEDGQERLGPRSGHPHGTLLLCFRNRTVTLREPQ